MLTLDPVQQVADEFRQQADEGQPSPAEQRIAQDWANSGSIGSERDLPSPSTPPSGGGGSFGNSNLERLASMMPPPSPDSSDETVTAPLTIHRMATQAIQPPSFMGGSVANLPGYDTSNTPQTLGGQAFAAGLPQPEQPTLLSAIDQLPVDDKTKQGLKDASPYIRDQLQKGQSFPDILTDVLGTPDMDTLHAAAALLNEPARITQHYTDKIVAPVAENTVGRIPVVGDEASKLVEGAVPFAAEAHVPVVGGPLVTQQLLFQVASTAEDWQQGKIDTKTAAEQLAPIVGGVAAGPLLKLIGKGASAAGVSAGEWLKSPEGHQAIRTVIDKTTGEPKNVAHAMSIDMGVFDDIERTAKSQSEDYSGVLRDKTLTPEEKANFKHEALVAEQKLAVVAEARGEAKFAPGEEEHVTIPMLQTQLDAVETELQRRAVPFGGRAAMPAWRARNIERFGSPGEKARISRSFSEDTPVLEARKQALQEIIDELHTNTVTPAEITSQEPAGVAAGASSAEPPAGAVEQAPVQSGAAEPALAVGSKNRWRITTQEGDQAPVTTSKESGQAASLEAGGAGGAPPADVTATGGNGGGEVLPPANKKFIQAMQQAVISPSDRAAALSAGRSRQAGGIAGVAQGSGSFEERLAKAGGAAKGQILPDFQAIGEKFTPDEMSQLTGQIDQAFNDKKISSFQWKTAGDVFQRVMLGGKEPQPAERKLLAQIFGPEFEQAIPKGPQQWSAWKELIGALGVPQAFSTSFDLSAPLRQGAVLGASHPLLWSGTFPAMVRAAASESAAAAVDTAIRERNPWIKGVGELDGYGFEDVGGHLSSLDQLTEAGQREGQFASLNPSFISRMVQRFPGIRQSERGFVTMLNKLRADVYASEAGNMWKSGIRDTSQYEALAKTINHATGWGDFKVGQITDGVNAFFSPRNLTARFQTVLDPITQPGSFLKPSARQLAAKNLLAFAAYNATVLGLVKMTGLANVELDPRSTDWGKARIGNTRIDLMAGYGPMVRLVARLSPSAIGGGVTKTATGNFSPIDRKQIVLDFLRGKLGPVPSLLTDAFQGKNMVGQKTDLTSVNGIKTQLYNSFVPFAVQDVHDAIEQQGIGAAAVAAPAGFFGAGVTSYANPSRDLLEARDSAAQADGYKDFADASAKLGANAAIAKYASNADVQKAQATLDENPSPFKSVQQNFAKDQADADAQYAQDHNVAAWKDAHTRIQAGQAAQLALIKQQNGGKIPSSGDKVLDGYYAVFDQFANPKTGIVLDKQGLSQALDEYVSKLSPQDQARIDANTGLKASPTEQAYRSAVKQLADAGYFDQEKLAYTSKKYSALLAAAKSPLAPNGLMPDKFSSLSAMKANYVAAYVKQHPQSDPLAAAADGGRDFERISAVKQLRKGLQDYRQTFYKSHPDLLRLATQWGFNTLSKAEEKLLPTPAR